MLPVKCGTNVTQSKILMFFKQTPPQIHNDKGCDKGTQTPEQENVPGSGTMSTKQFAQIAPIYTCELYFDGCSKGNPGPSGAGAVIYCNGKEVWSDCKYVGDKETNNYAEYQGLLMGLKAAKLLNVTHLSVFGDSNLVINHMLGKYQVKSARLLECFKQCKQQSKQFEHIDFHHVYRNKNERADQLSNDGLVKL